MNFKEINYQEVIKISEKAGAAILEIYQDPEKSGQKEWKADDSPLTLADRAAHQVIMKGLKTTFPNIPILSEEGEEIPYTKRKNFDLYWLVDPLDGTKEFINRNGEFTVNIALISKNKPVMGFIYVPVKNTTYYGIEGIGAFKKTGDAAFKPISVAAPVSQVIAVRSKSHPSPDEAPIMEKYDVSDSISVGSSLKFCMVAEGKAHLYYRHGPTMEWDTGAGQAIAEAAGAKVYKETGPDPLLYNKQNLLNPGFICLGQLTLL